MGICPGPPPIQGMNSARSAPGPASWFSAQAVSQLTLRMEALRL